MYLLNVFVNIHLQLYMYAYLFALLTLSSLIYHRYSQIIFFNLCDKIMIFSVVIYGGNIILSKILLQYLHNLHLFFVINIIITFLLTLYLYANGHYMNRYCFDTNIKIANCWHAYLHLISSIGHIMIALLFY